MNQVYESEYDFFSIGWCVLCWQQKRQMREHLPNSWNSWNGGCQRSLFKNQLTKYLCKRQNYAEQLRALSLSALFSPFWSLRVWLCVVPKIGDGGRLPTLTNSAVVVFYSFSTTKIVCLELSKSPSSAKSTKKTNCGVVDVRIEQVFPHGMTYGRDDYIHISCTLCIDESFLTI